MPASAKGITKKGTKCDVGPKKKAGPRAVKRFNKKTSKRTALKRAPTTVAGKIVKKTHAASTAAGRSASFKRGGSWAVKAKHGGKWPVHVKKVVETKPAKSPRFYPAEDIPKPFDRRKSVNKVAKLRASITPGTVLIILTGRFIGKRVVFLKQLESGLLLVTGPYKLNGVPLRRINQAYAIATSTKVSIDGIDVSKFNDKYFAKIKAKKTKTADGFFATEDKKEPLSDERKADQKAVDAKLLDAAKKTEYLEAYLSSKFSLSKSDKPHNMVFDSPHPPSFQPARRGAALARWAEVGLRAGLRGGGAAAAAAAQP
eukprot:CAMPEP_0172175186 /NCGR_PEP_ID=MMETSP1050-20130122/14078_1 /TAXON_ID=233186 /ORGANISM="Cryptomonas curvata, Strain CCAP979/52" /LENGTH=313 /DNA_ID=CAMNT_0012847241 /DNA_START=22 /DNA_END=960 /DNA_ORIENTATION=+